MYLPDPRKYDGAKRLVDVKLTATNFKDHIIRNSIKGHRTRSSETFHIESSSIIYNFFNNFVMMFFNKEILSHEENENS